MPESDGACARAAPRASRSTRPRSKAKCSSSAPSTRSQPEPLSQARRRVERVERSLTRRSGAGHWGGWKGRELECVGQGRGERVCGLTREGLGGAGRRGRGAGEEP
eukprot:3467572-Rhodomonas_salina.1